LCALYRTASIERALIELGSAANSSMRDLVGHLSTIEYVDAPETDLLSTEELLLDINTPTDLEIAHEIRKRILRQSD
jgi:molybdopterin-guanine dinucleotide biosynthesis protein A